MGKKIKLHLHSAEHGFDDFNVIGHPEVHRVAVGHGLKRGDVFNVYGPESTKRGAVWLGTIEASLASFLLINADQIEMTKANVIGVTFESRWEEGIVSTDAKLDLDTGIVFDIDSSDEGSEYESLIGEFVLIGDLEVAVELEPDDNYRIDASTLATIKMQIQDPLVERPRG